MLTNFCRKAWDGHKRFDVYVTVHRDEFLTIKPTWWQISQIYFGMKLYMFLRTVFLPIIRSFSLYTQHWYTSNRFAVCAVKNSWRWAEKPSETCRVLFQNKLEKLMHLVGFIIRKLSMFFPTDALGHKVNLSLCTVPYHAVVAYEKASVRVHVLLTSTLHNGDCSATSPGRSTPARQPYVVHRIR
jgi:hypothetical protein